MCAGAGTGPEGAATAAAAVVLALGLWGLLFPPAAVREAGTENMRQVAAKDLPKGPDGAIDFDEIVQGAAGNGAITENGTVRPLDVKVGDKVLFGQYSGSTVKVNGEECVIVNESDILGILS